MSTTVLPSGAMVVWVTVPVVKPVLSMAVAFVRVSLVPVMGTVSTS